MSYTYKFNNDNHYVEIDRVLTVDEQTTLGEMLLSFPIAGNYKWPSKFLSLDCALIDKELLKIAANAYDHYGNTVLGVACEYGKSVESVQKLIDLGADLDAKDIERPRLALHWAINNKLSYCDQSSSAALAVLECLLKNGAKTHLTCYRNTTPLQYARSIEFTAAATLIEEHNAFFTIGAIFSLFEVFGYLPPDVCKLISKFITLQDGGHLAQTRKDANNHAWSYLQKRTFFNAETNQSEVTIKNIMPAMDNAMNELKCEELRF